jgi:hypothetical protein
VVLLAAPSSDMMTVSKSPLESSLAGKNTEVVVASTSAPRFSNYFILSGLTYVVRQRQE